MCSIAGIFGVGWDRQDLTAMLRVQQHRGPDDQGIYVDSSGLVGLAHNRLSILDLSPAGRQPMWSADGRLAIVFNGEIYNYIELKQELSDYPYRTRTDTEVIFAAYEKWGDDCLHHFIGMFGFLLWDAQKRRLLAARDRFGVKPLCYSARPDGTVLLASEIKALHAAGVPRVPDEKTWATYLVYGLHDHCEDTFWSGVRTLRPGAKLVWQDFDYRVEQWYDPALAAGEEYDGRPVEVVREELLESLTENVKLRFRTDVPAGINLSGGLDSSTLLALVQRIQGPESDVKAFTFATGDSAYDELDSVREMLAQTHHPLIVCPLRHGDVPELAVSVAKAQDEPFGGIPTLAYARLCEYARAEGVIVLLDGQGMDEQWGGYEHYRFTGPGAPAFVHVTGNAPVCPDCLTPEFRSLAESFKAPAPFSDSLRNLQYRDLFFTKIPRALRFNDRVSMRASTELRVPFLDHRLVELSLRQPRERKLNGTAGKVILREVAANMLASKIVNAPKRSVQTPQREWLRTKLAGWAEECIEGALAGWGGSWLNAKAVRREWEAYRTLTYDNSFFLWQWISLALTSAPQVAYA